MALLDVSRMITVFQRLAQFAEEFTEEYRDALVDALSQLFRTDLQEGEDGPDVLGLIQSLLRRLRTTVDDLFQSETELIGSFKEDTEFRTKRERLTLELREVFDRARAECRNHFGREKSDSAGFPARIAFDSGALLRQVRLVSWTLRKPDFDLGERLIPNSITTAESILAIYEPKVEELRTGLKSAVRRKTRIEGKQIEKNKQMDDFRSTYALFVAMVRSSFRLAGKPDFAERLTLTQRRRSTTSSAPAPGNGPSDDTPPDDPPSDDPPSEGSETDRSEEPGVGR